MRSYQIFLHLLFVAFIMCGCTTDDVSPVADSGACLRLNIHTPGAEPVSLRSAVAGEDDYNENLLNSVYYFLYPIDKTDQEAAIQGYAAGISEKESYTEVIPVSGNDINNILFKSSRECALFVVANPSSSMLSMLKGKPTLPQLRAATVLSSLDGVQDNFIMVYDGSLEIDSRVAEMAVECDVYLSRLACKFTISAYIAQSISDESIKDSEGNPVTWVPVLEDEGTAKKPNVTLTNALNWSTLAGFDKDRVDKDAYFETSSVELVNNPTTPTVNESGKTYYNCNGIAPIYSYPMEWEFTDAFEPFLMYEIYWKYTDSATGKPVYQPRYYKLMLGQCSITSNDWYKITAKLTVLGGFARKDPTMQYLFLDYQVVNWVNAFNGEGDPNTPAIIRDSRYLMVPQTEWNVYNQEDISIPFSSSHTCDVYIESGGVFQRVYNGTKDAVITKDETTAKGWFTIDMQNSVLRFHHTLNNEMGDDLDCAPYEIEVYIYHSDQNPDTTPYKETIHIMQYPALYIDRQMNSNVNIGNDGKLTFGGERGYLWINDSRGTAQNSDYNYVPGDEISASDGVSNPYMTIINVSQFGSDQDFIIGDPRTYDVFAITNSMWTKAGASGSATVDGRTLQYYYAAREDAANFVAPKIRTVSAYCSGTGSSTYTKALVRCATYQEDGYPAGRWRLPTAAEIQYIKSLANHSKIIGLFYGSNNYWCSSGYVDKDAVYHPVTDPLNSTTTASSRCVYDEWYWDVIDKAAGNNHSKKKFYWGDQLR